MGKNLCYRIQNYSHGSACRIVDIVRDIHEQTGAKLFVYLDKAIIRDAI
jgi:hypothetical protein